MFNIYHCFKAAPSLSAISPGLKNVFLHMLGALRNFEFHPFFIMISTYKRFKHFQNPQGVYRNFTIQRSFIANIEQAKFSIVLNFPLFFKLFCWTLEAIISDFQVSVSRMASLIKLLSKLLKLHFLLRQ